ncbi:uracil-DNA glycosylase family protein [Bacteroidales bacterium OttesenSCG-928-B11]|nr:uracil-DNA glycosylase family protein [Bacteroidales bacterium OttesenSCG-928-C03]MDL2311776.1 uracil-DNA glycosylase family protein [Bacteroidales bacterium OttesenSCG-928-B11]
MENLKEKLEQGLRPLYEELFNSLHINFDRETETSFVMQWGENFPANNNEGILFIGKAVNGWLKKEDQTFEKLFARGDQMTWIDNLWKSKEGYATGRSAFWRVIKGIASKFTNGADSWHSSIAWSNLYKISPNNAKGGGNPDKKRKERQLNLCREILKKEIEILSPKYVILLTSGWESEPGFLWYMNDKQHTHHIEEKTWGKKEKIRVYKIHDIVFIASVHPQGKNESKHIEAITDLMKKY